MTSESDVGPERQAPPGSQAGRSTALNDHHELVSDPATSLQIVPRERLVTRRTIAWIFCGVIFALLPVWVDLIKDMAAGFVDPIEILRKGEQFAVGSVVALGAGGEVMAASMPEELKNNSLGWSFGALSVAGANIIAYTAASTATDCFLGLATAILSLGTLVVGCTCVRMAAGR